MSKADRSLLTTHGTSHGLYPPLQNLRKQLKLPPKTKLYQRFRCLLSNFEWTEDAQQLTHEICTESRAADQRPIDVAENQSYNDMSQ
ncbi:hypothetical protein M758_11G164200 [Ceratodon purpureus]|uniref:Uncharacterized protein n=1 Tax=Ceratodon purpureus TaxID=3225 RepID=A0A8T0GH79_CERPU|nr:hypothetical protein KC19_11G168400 [Ceratodon purpureus]KAG0602166.1 hypothetical protein M758_11G164200 [Ceratodon purpureus]